MGIHGGIGEREKFVVSKEWKVYVTRIIGLYLLVNQFSAPRKVKISCDILPATFTTRRVLHNSCTDVCCCTLSLTLQEVP
jgi:hypothetical protein